MTSPTRPIMRYHGGKWRLADWIIAQFPQHKVYVEPFGGAASVLMKKPRSHGEVYNDLDGDMVNVMRVIQIPEMREALAEALAFTPYAREEFEKAWEFTDEPIERARRTFIRAEMGFGSAGATKGTTGFRIDSKRNYGTAMQIWTRVPEGLRAFGLRLQGVLLENRPALQVMRDHDTPHTLFYVDPPYVHDTRKMGAACYRHEMTDADHAKMLDTLLELEGMVVLSGYPHPAYDDRLTGWRRVETKARMAAGRGTGMRTEVLWISPKVPQSGLLLEVA
ncbi:DNA adenine methylase [Pandoraea nosoerga]|uniref:DNA adenine methylase n=1 Tax=Pandoraea nosoerga TaxID=2508296 RepID=UPI00197F5FF1|nr:DNA adenine methylase [Pandoraea nosoerga]MBN4665396.1 DNA adenine methylase [Pandoraea nosoerga]MBN4674921.1 DNA adenine methylase [Pandoraea nosoerga]MBN4680237.1 DNA adenine methylase [Pandoraea nosoerga]MBN4744530.1 DNA adenine methylase [Pandoraea nosoerga]